MLCRFFSKPDTTRFFVDWVPLIDVIINSLILNWENILSDNFAGNIMDYRSKRSVSSREIPPFYMSAYVMEAIFFSSSFPTMGWKWKTQDPTPIHIYHRVLWESEFHLHFYRIFHKVILPMHQIIFNEKATRISKEDSTNIFPIARWFAEESFTYVRFFGSYASPHILPYYVRDKLLAREIAYQLVVNGISK